MLHDAEEHRRRRWSKVIRLWAICSTSAEIRGRDKTRRNRRGSGPGFCPSQVLAVAKPAQAGHKRPFLFHRLHGIPALAGWTDTEPNMVRIQRQRSFWVLQKLCVDQR
jgi:hypothetical protein